MDPSALIFVALAVAWAVYLVPKALMHHDDAVRSRSVDRFSHTMRVLARREPISRRSARLVVTPGRPTSQATVVTKPTSQPEPVAETPERELTPGQLRARRAAASHATKRRRNVLALIVVVNVAVVAVAAFAVISWWSVAAPVALFVAWLVACRVMVKGERRSLRPAARMPIEVPSTEDPIEAPEDAVATVDSDETGEIDPMADTSAGIAPVDPALWDPVPVTLPTYVNKPAATRRTVRTIDLDDTGVWTSGRTDADAQIARESDAADKAARKARRDGDEQRALGS
ncbi:hypothetical protein BH11ACT1_BH11ACT1_28470 [soil metagenome]